MRGIARPYLGHGSRHSPRGSDPARTDTWRDVGDPGTTWDSGTTYSRGDIVDDTGGIFQYQASCSSAFVSGTSTPNLGFSPGVTAGWQQFWNPYASIFQNGTNRSPTTAIPNPTPMHYRLSIGPPNFYDDDGSLVYCEHQIDIQGDITSILPGDTVFVILPEYQNPVDVPFRSHDGAGFYVPCRLLSTGEFVWGTP